MAIDAGAAAEVARSRVSEQAKEAEVEFVLLAEQTREIDQGWVFFYQSAEFVRTGNYASRLAGNGPILVTREGKIHYLPTAIPWEEAVKQIASGK